VRERLRDSYSENGRPSIDPELLLRILLIGYRYGITSKRKLVEELGMHLAWRWFTGLGFDQEIPHDSSNAWKWGWCEAKGCRSIAVSSKPMPRKRAAFHARSWRKRLESTPRCASFWWNWNSRTRWKNRYSGLRPLRLRRLKFVREQFFLAAAAQNIKRLVRFLHPPASPVLPATT
jgi:hypothetical protein